MDKLDELVQEYLKITMPLFLNGVTENVDELKMAYEKDAREYCISLLSSTNSNELSITQLLDIFIPYEIKNLERLTLEEKQALYLRDEKYEELMFLSYKGFNLARKFVEDNKTISEEELNRNVEKMKELLEKVKSYNTIRAQKLLSEGILDFVTATGKKEVLSLRLHRYIEDIDNKKGKDIGTIKIGDVSNKEKNI